jgi:DNA mismatch endonuclease, patch repair protein
MADTRSPSQRRYIMQAVGTKNTGPEMIVRKLVSGRGYRYRPHRKDLPGTPDLVFLSRRKVIFVNGCFWHGHRCPKGRPPKSRPDYWLPKIAQNKLRDARVVRKLRNSGWQVLTVWQCQTKHPNRLESTIVKFLGPLQRKRGKRA